MKKTVTALCKSRAATESALRQLESAGIRQDQISLLMTDETRGKAFRLTEGNKADEGMAAGATVGGIVGAMLSAVAASGTLVIPGLNLVVAGSLVGALAGLGAGAATGGIIGALVGAGMPEHEAKVYEKEINAGNILIGVDAETSERAEQIERILKNVDAVSIAA